MLNLYKNKGETPLQRLDRFRLENPAYKDTTLSYAGRLDPMAEGVLLVMEGDENNEREKYLGFDKEYMTEILLGVSTDTQDTLGLVTGLDTQVNVTEEIIKKVLPEFVGVFEQVYPKYSSKTVDGIPLFEYARKGEEVTLPTKTVELKSAELKSFDEISGEKLLTRILSEIEIVKGDFRQDEIKKKWIDVLGTHPQHLFFVLTLSLNVTSGFYVRAFAERFAKHLNTQALALSIKRTRVGEWNIADSKN